MRYVTGLLSALLLISDVLSFSALDARKGRMFWRTYTETQVQTQVVTSILPSSCVHVEPTLPACRGLRNLEAFPEFVGRELPPKRTNGRYLVPQFRNVSDDQRSNETETISWAEYLGLVGHTETVTEIHLKTSTVIDPRTVVTFSVKGCKPSRLPMELDRCPINQFNVDEIVPSSVSPPSIVPTISPVNLNQNEERQSKQFGIEPSSLGVVSESHSFIPTEDLSDVSLKKRST